MAEKTEKRDKSSDVADVLEMLEEQGRVTPEIDDIVRRMHRLPGTAHTLFCRFVGKHGERKLPLFYMFDVRTDAFHIVHLVDGLQAHTLNGKPSKREEFRLNFPYGKIVVKKDDARECLLRRAREAACVSKEGR